MTIDVSDLFDSALQCAALWHDGLSLDRYRNHIHKLVDFFQSYSADTPLEAIKDTFAHHGYAAAHEPDRLQNNNIIRVIERRTGSAISLGLLTTHCLRQAGYKCDVLDFPGHALCALTHNGERVIFNPSNQFAVLNAPELRQLVKAEIGKDAELSSQYMTVLSNPDILTRLNNAIKFKLIDQEAYDDALKIVDMIIQINPLEYKLLLEKAVLLSRTFHTQDAIQTLHDYIKVAPHSYERTEARQLIADLQNL